MIIIDVNINHQSALGMGQNTLGDHMHMFVPPHMKRFQGFCVWLVEDRGARP